MRGGADATGSGVSKVPRVFLTAVSTLTLDSELFQIPS